MTAAELASALPGANVAQVMSQPVLTVEVGESLWDAWQLLFVSGLRHLVVIDADGACVGVLADRTILADLPATQDHLARRTVSDVIARVPAFTILPDQSPIAAAQMMSEHTIEALPVVDGSGRLAGIVTEADVVRWLAS